MKPLASVGQITFWTLVVYLGFRVGDLALSPPDRGSSTGRLGAAFAAEILLGGILPLILLARKASRSRRDLLLAAALLRSLAS